MLGRCFRNERPQKSLRATNKAEDRSLSMGARARGTWFPPSGWRLALILCVSVLPGVFFLIEQGREQAAVRSYLESRDLLNLPLTKEAAIRVSEAVRQDFVVDPAKWRRFDVSRRPLLRHDTRWLLDAREGLCGEGTRVLVNLLNSLGFDATRVTLYDRHLRSSHTLVSLVIERREVFLNSINSSIEVTAFLNSHDVSTSDFKLLHYSDDMVQRRNVGKALASPGTAPSDPVQERFFEKFRLYSYEGIPATRFFNRLGLDWRVFNLSRPGPWVSRFAEKPMAIKALAALAIAALVDLVVLSWVWSRRRRERRREATDRPDGGTPRVGEAYRAYPAPENVPSGEP